MSFCKAHIVVSSALIRISSYTGHSRRKCNKNGVAAQSRQHLCVLQILCNGPLMLIYVSSVSVCNLCVLVIILSLNIKFRAVFNILISLFYKSQFQCRLHNIYTRLVRYTRKFQENKNI